MSTSQYNYPTYIPQNGVMTERVRSNYIDKAIDKKLLPKQSHRLSQIISLDASNDPSNPIQFWQLYSVMGAQRIEAIVRRFYDRVFEDEDWFTSVFVRVASKERHIITQAAMWIDVMGGGRRYQGGDFRLNFHHTHNAFELMNDRGAQRWVEIMIEALNDYDIDYTADQRVRPAVNTFLSYFMSKYAEDFNFTDCSAFGETNTAFKRRLNFLNMSSDAIWALSDTELKDELGARGIDVSIYADKEQLAYKALSL
jgi:truncated hemoglobin YjbI